ncbi:MAG TPA: glycosyltransferase family 87 protein [Phenylobacterium sp.]|uniref:glycosyltransferase family 87 protein n=1 Tax=Phenylobacterium sp. TaxID=1871053 RepID=UPI002B8DE893|nr:glycosyltransferase family 87 protein [Phenylobacterium sp.]HSV02566.1 glycosyltransferase family 87 protein [Phenylobacterium sp.]
MSDSAAVAATPVQTLVQRLALGLLAAVLAAMSLGFVREVLSVQPAGIDFAPLWAGGRAALHAPARLYDFDYVSTLQGWPLGRDHPRPFVYPPSALVVFAPLALIPYWPAFGLWLVLTGAAFLWSGLKAGAPWWFLLLPWVTFCALCGQVSFLLGALILAGLRLTAPRPILAGLLFGAAAGVKPQLLLLLPIALAAEARWRTILATAATGLILMLASAAVWGLAPWRSWIGALPRFQAVVFANPSLLRNAVTPYAALVQHGLPGAWAFTLAPAAALWVWSSFRRREDIAERLIALIGGALLISPYAMNYDMALFAPATGIYLARTHERRWPLYALAAYGQSRGFGVGLLTLLPALALPALRRLRFKTPSSIPNP